MTEKEILLSILKRINKKNFIYSKDQNNNYIEFENSCYGEPISVKFDKMIT